jgi:hypothetical protein
MTIESAEGAIKAAPTPWSILEAIRTSIVGAIPANTDAAVRTRKPTIKICLCPKVSDNLPPSSNRVPKAITYALKIHCKFVWVMLKCSWIVGRATPMIDVSRIIRNCANDKIDSAFHLWGFDTIGEDGADVIEQCLLYSEEMSQENNHFLFL